MADPDTQIEDLPKTLIDNEFQTANSPIREQKLDIDEKPENLTDPVEQVEILPENSLFNEIDSGSLPDQEALPLDESHLLSEVSDVINDSSSSILSGNKSIPSRKSSVLNNAAVDVLNSLLEKTPINDQSKGYKIGDIIWARIGKYPFWPSVVCNDPESRTYIKEYKGGKKFGLHVRFCNDKGRRSWIRTVENYDGKDALLSKYPNCLSSIKNSNKLMDTWNLAVEEANSLLKINGEARMLAFFKTFYKIENLNCLTPSSLKQLSEDNVSAMKVRTYSRKRSLATLEQDDSKLIKTENTSINGSISSRSIDIPLLPRSDDADSTVSEISLSYDYVGDIGLKMKNENTRKTGSKKTYPPKSSFTNKYNLSDSVGISPEYNDNSLLSDNQDKFIPTNSHRKVPAKRKRQISLLEENCEQENKTSTYSRSSKKIIHKRAKSSKEIYSNNDTTSQSQPQSSSYSKKTVVRNKAQGKESSTGRKPTTVKSESSPEPDTTGSEASSKNDTYSLLFLTSKKNKQLFVKTSKRACVVCKNIEDTVKCMGSCQSYFHKECLARSEERYKSEAKILNKKNLGRSKKHLSKSVPKNVGTVADIQPVVDNMNEENADKLLDKNSESKSLDSIESSSKEQCLSPNNEEYKCNIESKSDEIFINETNTVNESTEVLNELVSVNEELIQEPSEEKSTISTKPTDLSLPDEKVAKDDSKLMCSLCRANKSYCFACGLEIEEVGQKIDCKLSSCGKCYHEKCLENWPQCQWFQGSCNSVRRVVCPHHVCHLCISDNPKSSCKSHFPSEKLIRCIKCPTTYHRSEYCLPAGSQVLTYCDIICSRHFNPPNGQNSHFNATWCFICTLGGTLVCCDLCPSSFHIKCLNQNPSEFVNGFTCEECQTGRYPLYGEIVWVKIGKYRWWPAQIVFPNQVPDAVNAIAHSVGQFAVRFFGSYDYYWVNHGRVFNFHEGDDENMLNKNSLKILDQVFQDAIIEAAQAHNAYILDKDKNDAKLAKQSLTRPPKFVRIKFNKPFGNVKNVETNSTTMTPCECDPNKPNPCGPGSDCLNRMLMCECHPRLCPAKEKCNNQRFEKTLYPAMVPFLTKGRGWGLKTMEDIKEGSFVIEYVGDVIDEEEFQRRCLEMQKRNEQNYYFLTIDNSRMIDAGPKGNLSRFMNHSCEPNCVTQKWTVNGDTRIGLFALHDIPAGTELVFDYRLQSCSGVEKKPCQCGASRCSRFIGVKVDKEEEKKKLIQSNDVDKCKTSRNKRKPLKLKDNVSDSEKSKTSKVTNDQNISTIKNGMNISDVEKINDTKKSKTKTSIRKQSTSLKNGNLESSESCVTTKRRWRNSSGNSTNLTKIDDTLKPEETVESKKQLKNSLSVLPSRKQLIKKDAVKTEFLPLPEESNELSTVTTSCLSEEKSHFLDLKSIDDMTKMSGNSTKELAKTDEKTQVVLENASMIKSDKSMEAKVVTSSRHSLTRLAKSRHSFLSKNKIDKETDIQPVVSKKKSNKEKNEITRVTKMKKNQVEMPLVMKPIVTKKKRVEMPLVKKPIVTKKKRVEIPLVKKTVVIKKKQMNKHSLLSKSYLKNDSCMICGKGHTELSCKNIKCPRVFHLSCMNKSRIVKTGFICPSHFCSVCKKRKVVAKCKLCVESFCTEHMKGNILKDPLGNGMLCTTHLPNKKLTPVSSTLVAPVQNVTSGANVTNKTDPIAIALTGSSLNTATVEVLPPPNVSEDPLDIDTEEVNEEKYNQTQVIKDECDREYIHIGGFNVCNVSDLVVDQGEVYTTPVDTDGDLFKPSSANVIIDIESASALYQPTDSLQLVSIATENKDSHDYANVNFVPDVNQTKNKWLAAEP